MNKREITVLHCWKAKEPDGVTEKKDQRGNEVWQATGTTKVVREGAEQIVESNFQCSKKAGFAGWAKGETLIFDGWPKKKDPTKEAFFLVQGANGEKWFASGRDATRDDQQNGTAAPNGQARSTGGSGSGSFSSGGGLTEMTFVQAEALRTECRLGAVAFMTGAVSDVRVMTGEAPTANAVLECMSEVFQALVARYTNGFQVVEGVKAEVPEQPTQPADDGLSGFYGQPGGNDGFTPPETLPPAAPVHDEIPF